MTRLKNIFAVSFIAMFAVAGAHATIMTQDNIVGGTNITIDKPTSGTNAGKVVVNGPTLPTVNNATLTIQKNGTTVDSFTANASSNKTINITVPTSAADVNAVPTSRTVNGHALSSNVTVTKSDVGLGNVDNTSDANKPISTATQTALDGKQDANLVSYTSGDDYAAMKTGYADMTEEYPSVATVGTWIQDKTNTLGGQIGGKQDTLVSSGSGANVVYSGSGNVVTNVSATGGTVTVTKGTALTAHQDISGKLNIAQGSSAASKAVVTNSSGNITTGTIATGMIADGAVSSAKIADGTITTSDISSTAGITKGQLASAVQTSLGKADTALQSHQDISGKLNIAQGSSAASKAVITDGSGNVTTGTITSGMITDGTITTSDISSTAGITKAQLASAVQTSLGKADTALQSHQDISGKLNIAQGSSAASKAVVTNSSGNITTGTIATGMIADGAVSSAKIADGSIVNADISSSAAISPSKIATGSSARFVTDTEKNTWNDKQDANLVSYTSGDDYAAMKTGYADMTEEYPSVATVGTWIQDKTNTLGGQIGGKQPISDKSYNMGNASGGWTQMSAKQQNMLNGYIPATTQTGTAPSGYAMIWVE